MEDFVPFLLAKKLEEKGFQIEFKYALGYYDTRGQFMTAKDHWSLEYWTIAPTISQVLKWLREEKKIHIVCPFYKDKGFYYYVQRIGNAARIVSSFDDSDTCFDTAELAAIAGIEYVIDNLI